tara:strand:+ start:1385 stop:2170 length:786 start_codon:yes stop_codon:yes gene_type:complete
MNIIKFISRYIHYFLIAKNEHAIHGPFVFEFINKVLYKKNQDEDCMLINSLRKDLCRSKKVITITDFGAGSKINKSNRRKVKDIAKNSSKNSKFGKLLYRMVKFYKPKNIVELGTSLAISTCYLAKANTKGRVFTFEGCTETAKIAKQNLQKLDIDNTEITLGDFNKTVNQKLEKIETIDFAFIDGNHQEAPTINYFKECLKYSNNNTLFVFDDIHWSQGMENAWKSIKEHPKTTVTIDLFFIGIVFIKKELSKENFTIRF